MKAFCEYLDSFGGVWETVAVKVDMAVRAEVYGLFLSLIHEMACSPICAGTSAGMGGYPPLPSGVGDSHMGRAQLRRKSAPSGQSVPTPLDNDVDVHVCVSQ